MAVVSSILQSVLTDVFTQIDSTRPIINSEPVTVSHDHSSSQSPLPKRLLSALLPDWQERGVLQVLASDERRRIWQLAVKQQGLWSGGLCGYHALFNAFMVVKALSTDTDTDAEQCFRAMRSRAGFYFGAWSLMNTLKSKARRKAASSGPWSMEAVCSGELYRLHTRALQKRLYSLLAPHSARYENCFHCLSSLSKREMQVGCMSEEEVVSLQSLFEEVARRQHALEAFLVGVGDHWVSVVVSKLSGHTELIVLDSYNHPAFLWSDEEMRLIAAAQHQHIASNCLLYLLTKPQFKRRGLDCLRELVERGSKAEGVKSMAERLRDCVLNWQDVRHAVDTLHALASGSRTVAQIYSSVLVRSICSSFEQQNDSQDHASKEEPLSSAFLGMKRWLACRGEFCHPASLRECELARLLSLGPHALEPQAKTELIGWVKRIETDTETCWPGIAAVLSSSSGDGSACSAFHSLTTSDLSLLKQFWSVLQDLKLLAIDCSGAQ